MKTEKAFTLIELLLVISIIALLSSIVLSALGESRNKAKLAALKEDIVSLRNEGEIFYSNSNKYSTATQTGEDCPTSFNTDFGFLGSNKGVEIVSHMKEMGNTTEAKCWIKPSSWVVVLGTQNIDLVKNNSNVAYAAVDGKLCFDPSKNIEPLNLTTSANINYGDYVDDSNDVWVCTTN